MNVTRLSAVDAGHLRLRLQHLTMVSNDQWRTWPANGSRARDLVAARISWSGFTEKPSRSVEWPGGWFVELADGSIVFVAVVFRNHCVNAYFPRAVIQVRAPRDVPPSAAAKALDAAVCLFFVLLLPIAGLFFA